MREPQYVILVTTKGAILTDEDRLAKGRKFLEERKKNEKRID